MTHDVSKPTGGFVFTNKDTARVAVPTDSGIALEIRDLGHKDVSASGASQAGFTVVGGKSS